MVRERTSVRRVQVTFSEKQWHIINNLRGVMGQTDAEIVRNIVLAWLSEKSLIPAARKEKR